MIFANYTDAVLSALKFNPKLDDVVARKQEILDGVYQIENLEPQSVLFVGFNPAILSCRAPNIAVTDISVAARDFLSQHKIKFTYIDTTDLVNYYKVDYYKQFQCVVAMDEYFTYADSDADQQNKIKMICDLATHFVISTIRDYKNQDFKDREFSSPIAVRNSGKSLMYLESHEWDQKDRSRWNSLVHEIDRDTGNTNTYGPFDRRTMYFKQLAKFSIDAGAMNFQVHKNLMYKSLIKKNYEHVVSIQFE